MHADTTEPFPPAAALPDVQLGAGAQTITATYGGSVYHNASTSAQISVTGS